MSKSNPSLTFPQSVQPLQLKISHKQNPTLKISVIVSPSLTISHLKRKIELELSELHSIDILIKNIEDKNGYVISNNSNIGEHFGNGDQVYFVQHGKEEVMKGARGNGDGGKDGKMRERMNLASNLGEILATMRFVVIGVLEKMDRIQIGGTGNGNAGFNVLELVNDIGHLGLWVANMPVVEKVVKVYNKVFGEKEIQFFLGGVQEANLAIFLRMFSFYLNQFPQLASQELIFQMIQLFEKFSLNEKFVSMIKHNKLVKSVLQMSKDSKVSNQIKKMCVRSLRNINGTASKDGKLGAKIKSQYIPSMLGFSDVNGYTLQDTLSLLVSGSPQQKLSTLEFLAASSCSPVSESLIRSDYHQKLLHIFTLPPLPSKKHQSFFSLILTAMISSTSKNNAIQAVQKDVIKKVHSFMLANSGQQLHALILKYLQKITKISAQAGMFDIERGIEGLRSPYEGFVMIMAEGLRQMSNRLGQTSAIRFVVGIKQLITTSLKTPNQSLSLSLLSTLSNISLDQQCRYTLLNLKSIDLFTKFLQISSSPEIHRCCAKGLLNLSLSSRENKAKVLAGMSGVLERYYRMGYDGVVGGYLEAILKKV